jgi:hypothetical protein
VVRECGDGLGIAVVSVTKGTWARGVKDQLTGRSPVKWSAVTVSSYEYIQFGVQRPMAHVVGPSH